MQTLGFLNNKTTQVWAKSQMNLNSLIPLGKVKTGAIILEDWITQNGNKGTTLPSNSKHGCTPDRNCLHAHAHAHGHLEQTHVSGKLATTQRPVNCLFTQCAQMCDTL